LSVDLKIAVRVIVVAVVLVALAVVLKKGGG
jgi:hypothetical protein